jgi:propionyl-CoA carboxylase alpha chain
VQATRNGPREAEVAGAVMLDDMRFDVVVMPEGREIRVRFEDGEELRCGSDWRPGLLLWQGMIDETPFAVQLRDVLNGYLLSHRSSTTVAKVYRPGVADLLVHMPRPSLEQAARVLQAPMPCVVKLITVEIGQQVSEGETLCVLEAMKMEHVMRAEAVVTIQAIHVRPNESVALDAALMTFD